MKLEAFNPSTHDSTTIAHRIYETDSEIYDALFGTKDNALSIFSKILTEENDTYFNAPYMQCIVEGDACIGVVGSYEGRVMRAVERHTSKRIMKYMSVSNRIKRFKIARKVAKISRISMEDDALYILNLVIDPAMRGKGYGRKVIEKLHESYNTIYLHVNYKNNDARMFYESLGFEKTEEYYDCHKQTPIGYIILKHTV